MARLDANRDSVWWWWLRSPGRLNVKAVYVHGDGNIGIQGNNVLKGNLADGWCTGGVLRTGCPGRTTAQGACRFTAAWR